MRTIWKFPLEVTDTQTIEIPRGYRFLHLGLFDGHICLWCEVITESPKVKRTFWIFGTGKVIPDHLHLAYKGTVPTGSFVWHVFEEF